MKNKLLAQICKAVVISDILSTPVFTWRFLVGPVNDHLSIFVEFVRNINSVIIFLCFMEIITFRFLMLYGWKHFNSTNEEFMFGFLSLFNISFTFVTQLSRWMLGKLNAKFFIRNSAITSTMYNELRHGKMAGQFCHCLKG